MRDAWQEKKGRACAESPVRNEKTPFVARQAELAPRFGDERERPQASDVATQSPVFEEAATAAKHVSLSCGHSAAGERARQRVGTAAPMAVRGRGSRGTKVGSMLPRAMPS